MTAPHKLILATVLVSVAITNCDTRRDLREPGRRLTAWLYSGLTDSLPAGTILDLGATGDSILMRWFLDHKIDSLGPEWPPDVSLVLEGRTSAATFLARLAQIFGQELQVVDEVLYQDPRVPGSIEYDRVARFSGIPDNTVTVTWYWRERDALVGGWVMPTLRAAPTEFADYQTKAELRLPFEGEWIALDCGRKPYENYHVEHQSLRFACDFAVPRGGSLFRTDGKANADYYCYGLPILAPGRGVVVAVVDTFAENTPGHMPPGYRGPGNYVTLDHHTGEYSILAHLRKGSIVVAVGQNLNSGDRVGECGNNGLSMLPHLHYQLQLDSRPGERVVPAAFRHYQADGVFVERGEPIRGQRVRSSPLFP